MKTTDNTRTVLRTDSGQWRQVNAHDETRTNDTTSQDPVNAQLTYSKTSYPPDGGYEEYFEVGNEL